MAWTEEQMHAIYDRGSNIIVSAGAGSGKTAVLSERILDFCQKGGDIRRVLVLTFTEAAAKEMKERIRKKLIEFGLYEQCEYIDSAYITTFDSYSLSIVKRFYYKLELKKDVSIMDGAQIEIKRHEIIRELFTEYYLVENKDFLSFLKKYSQQDDKPVEAIVNDMQKTLDLIVDFDAFYKDYASYYFNKEKIESMSSSYVSLVKQEIDDFIDSLIDLRDAASYDLKNEPLMRYLEDYIPFLKSKKDYASMKDAFLGLNMPRNRFTEDVSTMKKLITDKHRDTKKVFEKYNNQEEMEQEIMGTKEDVLFLLSMVKKVNSKLLDYKKKMNMFGFTDIAKFAIDLVKENPDIKELLKNSYDEILVDEYQDTSDIQETFLMQIENNNRYMVGDIKQSIYRFRNANPYIFKEKYMNYGNGIGGKKIDLSYNFRSREEVLDNINLLFNEIMTMSYGDADYKKEHQMKYGQMAYLDKKQDISFDMDILSYLKDEDSLYTQAETEAFIIGRDIEKKMKSNALALRKNDFTPVKYNDFAILISTATEFLTFKTVFDYLNIPLSIEASLDLKDSILPKLYANFLVLICGNREQKRDEEYYHALASIARSFIYQYKDEDIYNLVYLKSYYPILKDIEELAMTDEISYNALFYKINDIFGIYNKLPRIGDVDSNLVVLEQIHNTFLMFDSLGYSFLEAKEYLKELLDSDIKMEYKPSSSSSNSVRIMTIHKSKGLEFPYVYFPLLTHGFNQADQRSTIGFHKDYGIFIPFADEGKSQTILRTLNQAAVKKADISEKIRLFYVALTRAREKMILILPKKEYKHLSIENVKSFAEMIMLARPLDVFKKDIDLKDYSIEDYRKFIASKAEFDGKKSLSYRVRESVALVEKSRISKSIHKLLPKETKDAISLGLEFHSALEAIDFKNPDVDHLPVSDFIKETLKELLKHPILKNISMAKTYHENEFYFQEDGNDYHGIIDLICEYDSYIDIIDYKLSNTDAIEYERQLQIYKDYVSKKTNKPVYTYLLSILKKEIKKIDI